MKWIVICLAVGTPLSAGATCPEGSDFSAELDPLHAQLSTSRIASEAHAVSRAIWDVWFRAPDEEAQHLLDEGVARIRVADYGRSEALLTVLTQYCPSYAEGWNQLAFAQYLQAKYEDSGESLQRALDLRPRHFAAMSGIGLVAMQQGKNAVAKVWIRRALNLHPFLKEARLLDLPDSSNEL